MASNNGNQTMAEQDREIDDDDRDEGRGSTSATAAADVAVGPEAHHGFFTIYKRGQGYWTRMGTAIGAALIATVVVYELFQYLPRWHITNRNVIVGIAVGFVAVYSLLVWWLMNRPTNADFLISTDSEMKKVNWTSRKELVGSTRVVVIFMFLIAAILFMIDVVFGYFFYWIDVLKFKPFGT